MMNDCVDEKWEQPKSNQSMNFKEREKKKLKAIY